MKRHRSAWGDGTWRGLPSLLGDVTADVCVVGLGGSGLAAVEALASADVDVVGIDAGQVAEGAAGSNGGFLLAGLAQPYHDAVAAYGSDTAKRMYTMTLGEVGRITAAHSKHVRCVGSLRIAASDEEVDDCRLQRNAMLIDGLAVETYQGPEGEGLFFPGDAAYDPLAVCQATAASLSNLPNVRLFEHTPATSISEGRVEFVGGRIACSRVIVAVDGHLDRLLPELSGRVHTVRLQMLSTVPIRRTVTPRPVYYRWGYDFWQQLPDGRIFLGGRRDRFMDAERTHDEGTSVELQDDLDVLLSGHLGVMELVERRWAASVGISSDGLPVVAQPRPSVWAVGGYNATGNLVGRLCGRAVADNILGRDNEVFDILSR